MNKNRQHTKPTVGLLLIVGEIISNEQRDEICLCLQNVFQQINGEKYREINDLFNNLIHENEFQIDSQYRQIANTENGSTAGFLYRPNFHTLLNVFNDLFHTCYHVCIIFCGQQVDSNGALILTDSIFTSENFYSLFEENTNYVLQDLQIVLPYVSNQWIKLSNKYLQKHLEHVNIQDLSNEIHEENAFGQQFYERLIQILHNDSINFDIYSKLIPRTDSGTIAFDEPNLYIFYGQQGEVSLFGIRGFVVLINGGYSRLPTYWNLIRGLQTIDACILTHFDYDVFPGLQTLVHRKQALPSHDEQLCKPDIGAIFLNHTQRIKLQSTSVSKSSSSSKLLLNLTEDIDRFLNSTKQLNIDAFNLIKPIISNKSNIEPINLYRKIAFGSLDLYVLHPSNSTSDDEKLITNLQKIPIRDQQIPSSAIPHHHWYSSCLLLVWTPASKSKKDSLVRILYTGACPQTLVFEALDRVRHLEFLHASQQQMKRTSNSKTTSASHTNTSVRHTLQKPKVSPPVTNRTGSAIGQNKTTKAPLRSNLSKPKVTQITPTKPTTINSKKPTSTSTVKKTTPSSKTNASTRSISKEKKVSKSNGPISKTSSTTKQAKSQPSKVRSTADQKSKAKTEVKPKKELDIVPVQEQTLESEHEHVEVLETENDAPPSIPDIQDDDGEQKFEIENNQEENSIIENEHLQNLEIEHDDEQILESQTNDYEEFDDNEQQFPNDNEFNGNNEIEDDIQRPDSISLTTDQNETFIQSNSASPMNEITSQISPRDPMTTSFIDGTSDMENPFDEKFDEDDEIEVIHHDIPASPKSSMPSIEDIDPQGLPIEKNLSSKPLPSRKLNNGTNRTNGSSLSSSSTRQSKQISSSIFNVDVAYIPYHGNEHYVNSEFFRRIRARYYILNAVQISHHTLESLLNGIQQWNKKDHALITLVPTFDNEQLRQFFVLNKNRLAELNINILPASSRCNVQYDNEGSPAQLLRFSPSIDTNE